MYLMNISILHHTWKRGVFYRMGKIKKAKHYIFVYGTLKNGFSNNSYLINAKFIKTHTLDKSYKLSMYNNGWFPEVIFETDDRLVTKIHGEIYRVNAEELHEIDYLEGVGVMYDRCEFMYNNKKCYIYIYINSESTKIYSTHIKNGNYMLTSRKKYGKM